MIIKNHSRWRVFAAGWLCIFFATAGATFSVFSKPVMELHGWSMTEFSLALSIYTLFYALSGIVSGLIADTHGATMNMYVGALLLGGGWFFTGRCETLTQLYLIFGIIAGSGGGTVYNAVIATTLRWFPDMKGKISGFLLAAGAIGPFTLAPLAALALQKTNVVITFQALGVLFFVTIAAVGWMMDSAPADYKPEGWHPAQKGTTESRSRDYTWKEMLATPMFYMLLIIYVCASTTGNMMISSTSVIAQTQVGLAATVGALVVSVITLLNFAGRLSFGAIYDKIGGFKSILLSLTITIAAMMLIGRAQSLPTLLICVILLGFSFGGLLVVFPPITSKYFGSKNLGVNYGLMFLGYAGGSFVGPGLSSYFLDKTGSFSLAYTSAAGLAAMGIVLTVILMLKENRNNRSLDTIHVMK